MKSPDHHVDIIGDEHAEFDIQGLRLDWFRLQVLTSVGRAALRRCGGGCGMYVKNESLLPSLKDKGISRWP